MLHFGASTASARRRSPATFEARALELTRRYAAHEAKENPEYPAPDCESIAWAVGTVLEQEGHRVRMVDGDAVGTDDPSGEPSIHFWLEVDGVRFDPKERHLQDEDPSFRYRKRTVVSKGKLEDYGFSVDPQIVLPVLRGSKATVDWTRAEVGDLPTSLYHGRTVDSTVFDLKHVGAGNDQDGPGFYFSNDPEDAWSYAHPKGVLLSATVRPRRLLPHGVGSGHRGRLSTAEVNTLVNAAPHLRDTLSNWDECPIRARRALLKAISGDSAFDEAQNLWGECYRGHEAAFLKGLVRLGYDAATSPTPWGGRLHLVVFNPDCITDVRVIRRRGL